MSDLRIGQLASITGVSVDTIRFYERRGLLPRARRERSGYRVFDDAAVERIKVVRALAGMNIELNDIRAMLTALRSSCASERPRLASALDRTEARIADLEAVRTNLRTALARCDAGTCELSARSGCR